MPKDLAKGVLYVAPSPSKRPSTPKTSPLRPDFKLTAPRSPRSILRSLLFLLPLFTVLPYYCKELHYDLPKPVTNGSPIGGRPVLSETNIIQHIQKLEDLGYRVIGTDEAVLGEEYVYEVMQGLATQCLQSSVLECDLWLQKGDGMHQFTIMDHDVLKSYRGIQNIIFRVSGVNTTTTLEGERIKNSVLLNSHIDSALPSKGSSDDGLGVGIMAEIARVLIERDEPITGSAVFLFNGAEESLQDASHLYSTQHETRHDIKTFINLEAAGTTGAAILFQATAQEMADAYSGVPRPHGNVIALEVFQSGIIMSDTDFGQFEKYLNVPGLDFSIVGHSYYYHTKFDTVENLEVGSSQHFGDTVLHVVDYLLEAGSPLNTDTPWSPMNSVYYSLYDRVYIKYSMQTADLLCLSLLVAFGGLFFTRTATQSRKIYYKAMLGPISDFLVGLLAALTMAVFLRYGLKKGQTWFTHEQLPLIVFGLPVLTAIIAKHYLLSPRAATQSEPSHVIEHAFAFASVWHSLAISALLQCLRVKSAYLFANMGLAGLLVLYSNEAVNLFQGKKGEIHFVPVYVLWTAISIVLGTEAATAFLDIFVPLVGRMGRDAPGEIIVAVISAFLTHQFLPVVPPFFHRFGRGQQRQAMITLLMASTIATAVFASPAWSSYDATHPKRTGVQWLYNVSSTSTSLHVAQLDSGPGYTDFVQKIYSRYGQGEQPLLKGGAAEWEILFPVSSFIESEHFYLDANSNLTGSGIDLPTVDMKVVADRYDAESGYRTMTIDVTHVGLLAPVFSFEAEVIAWSFRIAPPTGMLRHYVKANGSPGSEDFQMVLTVKPVVETVDHILAISYMGIDKRQFHRSSSRYDPNLPASQLFEEMNSWIDEEWKGSMEVLTYGAVCGVLEV